jgi:hypothetical protein
MSLSIFIYVLDNGLYNNEASGFGLLDWRKGKVHLWLQISCCMTQSGTRVQDRPIAAADFLQIPKPARHNDLHLHIFKKFPPKKKLLVVSPVECRRRRHTEILQILIEIQVYKYTNTQIHKYTTAQIYIQRQKLSHLKNALQE